MRELAEDYVNGSKAAVRDVFAEIRLNDEENTVYKTDRLMPISVQRGITDGSFGIGFTKSDRISFSVATTEKIPRRTRITLYTAFSKDGTRERLGRFYCENSSRDGNFINVTAFDAMNVIRGKPVKFTGVSSKNLAALEFPCMMQDVLDYIVKRWGLTCEFECQPFTVAEKPMKSETEPYSADEILGFIAACHGCNARFNYRGRLEFKSFTAVDTKITASMVLEQTIDDSTPFTVTGVLFTNGDNQIYIDDVDGSEYDEEAEGVIKCENPFATVEIAEYVWSQIGGLSYYAGTLKIRGAGILECGDVISVRNLKCPDDETECPMCITGISYSIGSDGFTETLSSEVNKSGGRSVSSSTASGGSGTGAEAYSAGDGIEITADEESKSKKISVKVGEGLEFDENGAVCSTVKAGHTIIIQEEDVEYLLHNYTLLGYIKGNRIVYGGPYNQIILQGHISYGLGTIAPNGTVVEGKSYSSGDLSDIPDMPLYQSFDFSSPAYIGTIGWTTKVELIFNSANLEYGEYKMLYTLEDGSTISDFTLRNYDLYNAFGFGYVWRVIYPPGKEYQGRIFEHGCAMCVCLPN